MITDALLGDIHTKRKTRKEAAQEAGVSWHTIDRHYRKKYQPKKKWTKYKGKVYRYDVKKSERAHYLRLSGETWPEIAKAIYKDRTLADRAMLLARYYERDFCG